LRQLASGITLGGGNIAVNILEHELVPKHEVLSKEEKRGLLERLATDEKRLPMILDSDPIVKKIEAKPGDVLRITRKSQTAGKAVYYRLVTDKARKRQS
jgi:DNA-directed RNA polymerase subunit H